MSEKQSKTKDAESVRVNADVRPPEGYRLLEQGEVIRAGDICMVAMHHWEVANQTGGRWNPKGYWPMARRTEAT